MLKLLICLCVLSVSIRAAEDQLQQPKARFALPCTTPNLDTGICVEIKQCSVFIHSLASGKTDNHDFIRESRCGESRNQHEGQPKVCCGKYDDYLRKTTIMPTTSSTEAPKKSKAPNNDMGKPPKKGSRNPFPETCGNQTTPNLSVRIVGGKMASVGEFPWMARLRHRRKDGLFSYGCAGFLISNKFVLTAAHCIRSKALAALGPIYQVQLGEHNTLTDPDCSRGVHPPVCADSPLLVRTANPKVHPEYSDDIQHHNDIALIPLKKAVKFTEWVYPICLAQQPSSEREMWLSGWGRTDTLESSPIKLKVSVWRENRSSCATTYRAVHVRVIHSQLCAGGEAGRDSCTGDSGGPLMIREGTGPWQAEGVVSFGMGCGLEGWPGIYTNIPSYMTWIRRVINRYLRKQENKGMKN